MREAFCYYMCNEFEELKSRARPCPIQFRCEMCKTINEFRQTDLLNSYHKDARAFIHATIGPSDVVFTGGF